MRQAVVKGGRSCGLALEPHICGKATGVLIYLGVKCRQMKSVPLPAARWVQSNVVTLGPTIFLDSSVLANWRDSFGSLSSERGEVRHEMSSALHELSILTAFDWEFRSDYELGGFTSLTPPPTYAELTSLPTVPTSLDGVLFTYPIYPETYDFEEIITSRIGPWLQFRFPFYGPSAFREITFASIKINRLSSFLEQARGRLRLLAWRIRLKIRLAGVPRFFQHVVIAERSWFLYHDNHPPKFLNGLIIGLQGFWEGCAPRPLLA